MKINNQQLIGLSVVTQAGQELGQVEGFNIDTDSQSVLEYKVKPSSLVKELIAGDFIIPRGQIIEIRADKVIVEDNFSQQQVFKKPKAVKQRSVAMNTD